MNITKDPISRLITKIAIPTSVGFLFHTLFNVVDTYYAGLLSTDSLAALSLSFPIYFSILAFSIGMSQGTTALISNALGAKYSQKSKLIFTQALSLGVLISMFLTVISYFSLTTLFNFLGAEQSYLHLCLDYMNTIVIFSIFFMVQNILNSVLMAHGYTKPFRNFLIFGFFINLALDPLLMFGYGFIPALGLQGLAIATIMIQFFGVVYLVYKIKQIDIISTITLNDFIPNSSYFVKIIKQAFPASLNMLSIAIGSFIITFFVGNFGKFALAAYGASLRIEQLFLLPSIGVNSAVLTIVGQNNGAKLFNRVKETWIKAIFICIAISIVGGAILYLFKLQLLKLFTNDPNVIEIGNVYLIFASFSIMAYAVMFTTNSLLQGLKKPKIILYIGLIRQFIAPVILFPELGAYFGINGIWIGVISIVWISNIITIILGYRAIKQLK